MVLINCKEGLKEISSKAEICPKCGIKLKKKSYILCNIVRSVNKFVPKKFEHSNYDLNTLDLIE
jgi:hypothetical protein